MGISTGVIILIVYYFLNAIYGAYKIDKPATVITPGVYVFCLIVWILLILAVIFL